MSNLYRQAQPNLKKGINNLTLKDVTTTTVAVLAHVDLDTTKVRPLVTPIYQSSTYDLDFVDPGPGQNLQFPMFRTGFSYGRLTNPSQEEAEGVIVCLEEGEGSLAFCSGSAATSTALLAYLRPGDHLIISQQVYAGTHFFVTNTLEKELNVIVSWVNAELGVDEFRKLVRPNTKVLFAESPCNPTMEVIDLEEFGKLGQELGILTIVDSTFGTPYLQKPCTLGIDITAHSCTKYMGGHADLLGGCLTTRTHAQWSRLKEKQCSFGNMLSPADCSLLVRGLRTLAVRMDRYSSNAMELAQFLEQHPKIEKVSYPGLPSHPGHKIAKKQMKQFGGVIAFVPKGGVEGVKAILKNLRIIHVAVSLGAVESLIECPMFLTHAAPVISKDVQAQNGITPTLLRFSVGIEDVIDLKKDLSQALDKVQLSAA